MESLGRESKGRHYRGERSGGRAEGRGRDFWRRLGGEVELQGLQQEQVVVFRLGMAGHDDGAAVGGGQLDVDHLDGSEFLEHGAGRQSRRQRLQPLFQRHHQAIGEERHEYVGFDAVLQLMMYGPNRQIVLQFLEGLLDLDQLKIEPPEMAGVVALMLERSR